MKAPPLQELTVGKLSMGYRSYAGLDVCLAEDPAGLVRELEAMNTTLAELLHATSAGKEGYWTDEQLVLLEESQRSLGQALDAHEPTLQQLSACPPIETLSWTEAVRTGQELSGQARRRIAEAPEMLVHVRAIREVKSWREKQLADQKRKRRDTCPEKPGKTPVVYFAWQDAVGKTEWLFCDTVKVAAMAGKAPEYVPPDDSAQRPKSPQQAYLNAAAKFPEAEIRRSPKLPVAKPRDEDQEEPIEATVDQN